MNEPGQAEAVASLEALLTIEELDKDLFRSDVTPGRARRIFGGQVVAQALAAAGTSVAQGQAAHSLHAYFLRPGDSELPVIYRVLRDFDGGSFSNRRVVAVQKGQPILNLAASFHREETGFDHALAMPAVLPPEECPTLDEVLAASRITLPPEMAQRLAAFDVRPGPPAPLDKGTGQDGGILPRQYLWFRLGAKTSTPGRVITTYVSDFALVTTALLPHSANIFSPDMQVASLDHAMWFHAEPVVDDWLLYTMESPWAGQARGLARGALYDRAGRLMATVAQEGLLRRIEAKG